MSRYIVRLACTTSVDTRIIMIFILNLKRHATFHGHNSMYVRRPDARLRLRRTWILLFEGQTLSKGTSRTRIRPSHVKIMTFILKKPKIAKFPYKTSYFAVIVLGAGTLEDYSQLPKKANKCSARAVASFSYVWRHQ